MPFVFRRQEGHPREKKHIRFLELGEVVPMDKIQQLEHRALRVRWQDHGSYRGKQLCQICLMEKARIGTSEDRNLFEQIWDQWARALARDRCAVCGEQKETMTLPAR